MKATDRMAEKWGQKIMDWMDKEDVGPITLMVIASGIGMVLFALVRIIFGV